MRKLVGVLALVLCVSTGLHAQSGLAARKLPPGVLEAVQTACRRQPDSAWRAR